MLRTILLLSLILFLGCSEPAAKDPEAPKGNTLVPAGTGPALEPKPVPIKEGAVTLGPENSRIVFRATHTGKNPDPDERTGMFESFSGTILVKGNTIEAIKVEIETSSVYTPQSVLTEHLKGADFFDSRQFPTMVFEGTNIVSDNKQHTIEGELTLLGKTTPLKFPATVAITPEGFSLKAEFEIDRTVHGMDKKTEGVDKMVKLLVYVGHPTVRP